MKKLFCIILATFITLFALTAQAEPWLVCDPQAGVDSYEVDINGTVTVVPPDASGQYGFKMDLGSIDNGTYTAKARAWNLWGWSDWSLPFGFVVQRCGAPQTLRLTR